MNRLIRAVIDPGALRNNLRAIREHARGARVMAVVKANAYGHGLVPTALALAEADAFAVARLEEGLALRAAGITQPIVLLEGVFTPEHVLEAAPAVAEILTACPGVKVLATSRAGLHIRGEWLWPVSPLA